MLTRTENLRQLIGEVLERLDGSNVGSLTDNKNKRNAEGKANSERQLYQTLS